MAFAPLFADTSKQLASQTEATGLQAAVDCFELASLLSVS